MLLRRDLYPCVLEQTYAIPAPEAPMYNFWWPWVKNYVGEIQVGYGLGSYNNWTKWIWIDTGLKSEMGH